MKGNGYILQSAHVRTRSAHHQRRHQMPVHDLVPLVHIIGSQGSAKNKKVVLQSVCVRTRSAHR